MALLLNHTDRSSGLNLSLADPFLILTIGTLIVSGVFKIPIAPVVFFCVVAAVSGLTVIFATPEQFHVSVTQDTPAELLKMFVCLLYLVCGVNLARIGMHIRVLRWFAIGASLVAAAGIVLEILGIQFLREIMYYSGVRYRGFMVDPNYWAVLACSAIAILLWDREIRRVVRFAMVTVLVISVLMSASKTGLITLLTIVVIVWLERAARSRNRVVISLGVVILAVIVAIEWNPILENVGRTIASLVDAFPQLARIQTLINDPIGAISEGGSGRADTWEAGLSMIEQSPLFGVGAGAYRAVNWAMFGGTTVAHNTYLQIAAEWGLPLAAIFFGWLLVLLLRATRMQSEPYDSGAHVLRNVIMTFLVGSISLSLNNARMFWLFLGMLIYVVGAERARRRAAEVERNFSVTFEPADGFLGKGRGRK